MIDNCTEYFPDNPLLAETFALFSTLLEHVSARPALLEAP